MSQRPSQAEMTIMMEEYYLALGNLSPDGMRELTDQLKAKHKWFPSISECMELITPKAYSNPFYCSARLFYANADPDVHGSPITSLRRSLMVTGETRTWTTGERTYLLIRTYRPYVFDLCDAYNRARPESSAVENYVDGAGNIKMRGKLEQVDSGRAI